MPPSRVQVRERRRLTLDKIGLSHSMDLCLSADYTTLKAKEAFRELAQNWRDGILDVLDLDPQDFMRCITREDTMEHGAKIITFRAFKPDANPRKYGGYIRFRQWDGHGTVELTNFDRTLQPWHLTMGGTSKRNDSRSVGTHGEGANLAILTMVQQATNHDVRYRSGGYDWIFEFNDNSTLTAIINRIGDDLFENEYSRQECVANPMTDLSVIIGSPAFLKNEAGEMTARKGVSEDDFTSWLETTLFLQDIPPQSIISTPAGSLLLNHGDPGKIFLKGFLLAAPDRQSASMTGKKLEYSYDFRDGTTNRDRITVANAKIEAQNIAKIWHHAIEQRPGLVEKLHKMLFSEDGDEFADIHGSPAYLTKEVAMALKKHLLDSHRNTWFHSETESKDPQTLQSITGFDMEALELPKRYFQVLRRGGVARTVDEENRRRANNSPLVEATELPQMRFSQEVHRIVKHLIANCDWTADSVVQIMQARELRVPLLMEKRTRTRATRFKVHELWFSDDSAAKELGVRFDTDRQGICTASIYLFGEILSSLPINEMETYRPELRERQREWNLRSEKAMWAQDVHVAVFARPVTIETCRTSDSAVLVKWELPVEWRQDLDDPSSMQIEVQVHAETDCNAIRWYGPETYYIDDGPARCNGHGCWCVSGNGLMTEAVIRIANSTKRYFAAIINRSEPTCIPLISEDIAIPHQGPAEFSEAEVPDPPMYKCGRMLEALTLREPQLWFSAVGHSEREVVIGKTLVKQELGKDDKEVKIEIKDEDDGPTPGPKKRKLGSSLSGDATLSPFSSSHFWEL